MELIQSLTESKLFSSKNAFQRYTGRQLAELCYLHILGLRIMSCEKITIEQSKRYAVKTSNHDDFKKWHQSSTDLFYLMFALKGEAKTHDSTSEHYIKSLSLDMGKINAWLLSMTSRNAMSDTRSDRLFASLDKQFKINDGTYRAIRRLVMNWPELSLREKQLAFTRLIQIMRARCPSSDIFPWLDRLSRNNGLELNDVCDLDSGEGCGSAHTSLYTAAALNRSIYEDGDAAPAVATTAADIAPVVKPLGKTRRRNPK